MTSRSRRLLIRRRRRRRRRERRPLDRRRIAQRCLPLLLLLRGRRRRCDRGRWRARHCHGHHRHDFDFAFAGRRCCRRCRRRAGQTGNFRGGRLAVVEEPPTLVAAAPHGWLLACTCIECPARLSPLVACMPGCSFVQKNGSSSDRRRGAGGRSAFVAFKKKFPPKQATRMTRRFYRRCRRILCRRTDLSQQK